MRVHQRCPTSRGAARCCCGRWHRTAPHRTCVAPQVGEKIPAERLYDCVTVILSYQNADGGMATYENTRSFHWLEVGDARPRRGVKGLSGSESLRRHADGPEEAC